jgi:hypothetical protein
MGQLLVDRVSILLPTGMIHEPLVVWSWFPDFEQYRKSTFAEYHPASEQQLD